VQACLRAGVLANRRGCLQTDLRACIFSSRRACCQVFLHALLCKCLRGGVLAQIVQAFLNECVLACSRTTVLLCMLAYVEAYLNASVLECRRISHYA
jgi:hypothetical protein